MPITLHTQSYHRTPTGAPEFLINFNNIVQNNYSHVHTDSMNDLFKDKGKSQVRRLLGMQSLLEEYDRENRYLNKQVLQLLAENKALKIDKVRQKSLKFVTEVGEKQPYTRGRLGQFNGSDLVSKWKREFQRKENRVEKNIEKKEEGVQVEPAIKVTPPKAKAQEPEKHKQICSEVFSFGENTSRSNQKLSKELPPPDVAHQNLKEQSLEKVGSTGQKEGLIAESREKTFIMDVVGIESSERFFTEDRQKLRTEEKDGSKQDRSRQSLQSNDSKRQRGKSSHAINPSPRIVPSSCEKKQQMSISGSRQKTFIKLVAHQSLHRVQSAERKRFIDVVSRGQSAIKGTFISKHEGCC